ncbi:5-formyltetrahydrofolate cyclo-ligase [Massilia pseudoviolaceinigra]|uniref:5-formyltetrahydrofolate cyclo-ligase n=1 Tax=Massilia pseudoviolaceinigra TaxID=3057165 RepID=UPI002796AF5C|nr:5-formyltetrahydrofolate cyclo-ligase [Massilia sp. CCM 9206]MDQ1924753.1 5-formyltetrahydrofolate cyclo-ligase [Massilia sp. CCM 9206]
MTGEPRIPCGHAALPASANSHAAFAHGADKAALRAMLKAARRALDPLQKAQRDAAIAARVLAWWQGRMAGGAAAVLGVYWPLRGEPDLQPVYAELAGAGVRLALPLVVAPDTALAFVEWVPGEDMLSDRMGVAVPAAQRVLDRPPVLLVPCLGFTAERYRLGYGGGYYDRTLEALPRPYTVGIAYAGDQVEFAGAQHDVALDVVITER